MRNVSEREEMIRVRTAYHIVGSLPIDNFPKAAAMLLRAIWIIDSNYAECWGEHLNLDTSVLDALATETIDHGIADGAMELVGRIPRGEYEETRAILEHVIRYFISDIQRLWSQTNGGGEPAPIRELLRVVRGGAA
jgi:hypothetical protein